MYELNSPLFSVLKTFKVGILLLCYFLFFCRVGLIPNQFLTLWGCRSLISSMPWRIQSSCLLSQVWTITAIWHWLDSATFIYLCVIQLSSSWHRYSLQWRLFEVFCFSGGSCPFLMNKGLMLNGETYRAEGSLKKCDVFLIPNCVKIKRHSLKKIKKQIFVSNIKGNKGNAKAGTLLLLHRDLVYPANPWFGVLSDFFFL